MYGVWMLDVLLTFVTIITVYAWLYAWRSGKHGSCHAECQGSTPGQVTHFFHTRYHIASFGNLAPA